MKLGDVVIAKFPFTNLQQMKVRPAVVVTVTDDKFQDVVLCMISSNVPEKITHRELVLTPSPTNGLRVMSVVKAYRIATVERSRLIDVIGQLGQQELDQFINVFQSLTSIHE